MTIRLAAPCLLLGVLFLAHCAHADVEEESDLDAALFGNAELDLEVLNRFPAKPRAEQNLCGQRDAEIRSWHVRYLRTADGFEGLVMFGSETNEVVPFAIRYLMALDARNRQVLLIDGVASERSSDAAEAIAAGSTQDFVSETFDDVTVQWLRSELYRILGDLDERLEDTAVGLGPRTLSAAQICALRLAIYAGSFVLPFTKVPLVGKGATLTGQFVGSFLFDATGSALLGQTTEAARSAAAATASGAALASVFSRGHGLVRSFGASGVGLTASFVVGAVLGADGDYQLMPGDRVEGSGDETIIVHGDGSRTTIPKGGFRSLLPASCRQALATKQ